MLKNSYFLTGLASLILAVFLFLVAIPFGVSTPSNVAKVVLSPLFWPQVLSVLLGITGISLMLSARNTGNVESTEENTKTKGSPIRLALLAVLMIAYIFAIPTLGLVWSSMVAFVALAVLIKSANPMIALISAIVIPLALYLFFAHVAGIAIPQGDFVRLP